MTVKQNCGLIKRVVSLPALINQIGLFFMQVSKRKVSQAWQRQANYFLYQTVADIKSPKEAKLFLKDLFSKTEFSAITKRLTAAYLLDKGKNYQEIKDALKLSSATISVISDQLEKGKGLKMALKKIQADEWADKWAIKIKKILAME